MDSVEPIDTIRRFDRSVVGSGIPAVVMIHITMSIVSNGFLGFYPTYLIEIKNFIPQVAAIIYSLAAGIVLQPLTGTCRDRFGSRWTIAYVASMVFMSYWLCKSAIHLSRLHC